MERAQVVPTHSHHDCTPRHDRQVHRQFQKVGGYPPPCHAADSRHYGGCRLLWCAGIDEVVVVVEVVVELEVRARSRLLRC